MYTDIKTASDLKYALLERDPQSHFFDRETMQFFGDRMDNFGLRHTTIICSWDAAGNYRENGVEVPVFELFRRKPVKCGLKTSAYFRKDNLKFISPKS